MSFLSVVVHLMQNFRNFDSIMASTDGFCLSVCLSHCFALFACLSSRFLPFSSSTRVFFSLRTQLSFYYSISIESITVNIACHHSFAL